MLAKMLWTLCATSALCTIAACRVADAARPESQAKLTVTAMFAGAKPTTDHGTIRMTVHGIGESDGCGGRRTFTATYRGALARDSDGTYSSQLYPTSPTIATEDDRCAVDDLHVEQITSTQLDAKLGDLEGTGTLTFQTLTAVDDRELSAGRFDDLHGAVTFR